MGLFCEDGTNRAPETAAAVTPEHIVGTEGDAPRAVRVVRIEGRRPQAAGGTGTAE